MRNARLDGLRGVAIILVILQHFVANVVRGASGIMGTVAHYSDLGWTGVDLFFVLSGFLICGILLDHRTSPNLLRTFYVRRSLRILPLYVLLLISFVVVRRIVAGTPFKWMVEGALPVWPYLIFIQNFFMAQLNTYGGMWLGVTWSLAVEEQFYLTLPVLVLALPKWLLGLCLAAFFAVAPLARALWPGQCSYVLLPWRGDGLAIGALLAMAVRSGFLVDLPRRFGGALVVTATVLGIVWARTSELGIHGPLSQTISVAFFANLVLVAYLKTGGLAGRCLEAPPLVWIGRRSYSIYLVHYPVWLVVFGVFTRPFVLNDRMDAALLGLTLLVTFAWAAFSWEYFEAPLLELGQRLSYEDPKASPRS